MNTIVYICECLHDLCTLSCNFVYLFCSVRAIKIGVLLDERLLSLISFSLFLSLWRENVHLGSVLSPARLSMKTIIKLSVLTLKLHTLQYHFQFFICINI